MATILVVDDEPEIAGLMSDWLRMRGYDVLRAGAHEQPIRLTGLLGSGPGYERYGFVTDRADGAAAPGA